MLQQSPTLQIIVFVSLYGADVCRTFCTLIHLSKTVIGRECHRQQFVTEPSSHAVLQELLCRTAAYQQAMTVSHRHRISNANSFKVCNVLGVSLPLLAVAAWCSKHDLCLLTAPLSSPAGGKSLVFLQCASVPLSRCGRSQVHGRLCRRFAFLPQHLCD